ncbi:adenylate kinase [Robbsia sp. KACC 23696]|uniref:adenylate kinase n=1 Tax=Robbsia sp. KACC 23696 TaxID=3149231 RepID=UPI00325BBF24
MSIDLRRTIIIGNAGSGKSWLAARLAARLSTAWVDLDLIHWMPGGFNVARDRTEALQQVQDLASGEAWVIEGIYGWLVDVALASATALIWLDLSEDECVTNIRQRGVRRGGTDAGLAALVQWAESYGTRRGSSSRAAHATIVAHFPRETRILRTGAELAQFVASV